MRNNLLNGFRNPRSKASASWARVFMPNQKKLRTLSRCQAPLFRAFALEQHGPAEHRSKWVVETAGAS